MIRVFLAVISLLLAFAFVGGCKETVPVENIIEKTIGETGKALPDNNETTSENAFEDPEQSEFDDDKQSMMEQLTELDSFVKANGIDTSSHVPFCLNSSYSMVRLDNGSLCFRWYYRGNLCLAKWDNGKWLSFYNEPLTSENVMLDTRALMKKMKIIFDRFSIEHDAFVFAGYHYPDEINSNRESDQNFGIYYARWNGKNWVNASNQLFTFENGEVVSGYCSYSSNLMILDFVFDCSGNPSFVWEMVFSSFEHGDYHNDIKKTFFAKWSKNGWTNIGGKSINKCELMDALLSTEAIVCISDNHFGSHARVVDYTFTADGRVVLYLFWDTHEFIAIHNGNGFENLTGNPLTSDDFCYLEKMCFSGSSSMIYNNGMLHIAANNYVEYNGFQSRRFETVYMKWDGRQWVNDYSQKATKDNIIVRRFVGWAGCVRMVLDKNERPCLVWQDAVSDSWEIYFARWNGKMWTNAAGEYFTTQNGNVSRNKSCSKGPNLVLDDNNNPIITWSDEVKLTLDGHTSFVKVVKWIGNAWVPAIHR